MDSSNPKPNEDQTLEDNAWKDSFDKLLSPRPALRNLQVLKTNVRASFNKDSSVENSVTIDENAPAVPTARAHTSPHKWLKVPCPRMRGDKRPLVEGVMSTPVADRAVASPFKCSLSPIGGWELRLFCQKQMEAVKKGTFSATPVDPEALKAAIEYDSISPKRKRLSRKQVKKMIEKAMSGSPGEDSLKLLQRRLARPKQRVCFDLRTIELESSEARNAAAMAEGDGKAVRPHSPHLSQRRLGSIPLRPGKWRKSLIAWRRTHLRPMNSCPIDTMEPLPVNLRKSSSGVRRSVWVEANADKSKSADGLEVVATTAEGFAPAASTATISVAPTVTITEPEVVAPKPAAAASTSGVLTRSSSLAKAVRAVPTSKVSIKKAKAHSFEQRVLSYCDQSEPMGFDVVYTTDSMPDCRKIGEGAYGEVFITAPDLKSKTVYKIIPIDGKVSVNGEPQKTFEQILPEIIITYELSNLRDPSVDRNITKGFVHLKKVSCVHGKYPQHLITLWKAYDTENESDNDNPIIFPTKQIYIVFEMNFGGEDMESFTFQNAEQAYCALRQLVLTLAVGEEAFQFEHRDLHWGNVLLMPTKDKTMTYRLQGKDVVVATKGVHITIIDYTLARMTFEGCCYYNDLSTDDDLFSSSGDYQFDIYRMMRDAVHNNWECYEPKTNIFWVSYIASKMIKGVHYKSAHSKNHRVFISKLKQFRELVLSYPSATACVEYF